MFNCILARPGKWTYFVTNGSCNPSVPEEDLSANPAALLPRAASFLQNIGNGRKLVERIRRTVLKLSQICNTLGQIRDAPGQARTELTTASASTGPAGAQEDDLPPGELAAPSNNALVNDPDVFNLRSLDESALLLDSDLLRWDAVDPQSWWEGGMNLFNELDSVEGRSAVLFSG